MPGAGTGWRAWAPVLSASAGRRCPVCAERGARLPSPNDQADARGPEARKWAIMALLSPDNDQPDLRGPEGRRADDTEDIMSCDVAARGGRQQVSACGGPAGAGPPAG